MTESTVPAIEISHLSKTFGATQALQDVSLTIGQGEMVALIGPSGSGKSTLLRHLTGLVAGDRVERSRIAIDGRVTQAGGRVSGDIRDIRKHVGFIFQQFNLVGRLSLLTNVLIGLIATKPLARRLFPIFTDKEKLAAMAALDRVGIAAHAAQLASTLSGGQQQRGAIARGMLQEPRLMLADEPIASLDPTASHRVMESLRRINGEGVTVVVSLHQIDFARKYCDRAIALRQGALEFDGPSAKLEDTLLKRIYGEQYEEFE